MIHSQLIRWTRNERIAPGIFRKYCSAWHIIDDPYHTICGLHIPYQYQTERTSLQIGNSTCKNCLRSATK